MFPFTSLFWIWVGGREGEERRGERRNKCSHTNRKKLEQKYFLKKYLVSDRAVFLKLLFTFLELLFTSLYSSFLYIFDQRLSRGGSRQTIHTSHVIE
jgi:hypothetical protein